MINQIETEVSDLLEKLPKKFNCSILSFKGIVTINDKLYNDRFDAVFESEFHSKFCTTNKKYSRKIDSIFIIPLIWIPKIIESLNTHPYHYLIKSIYFENNDKNHLLENFHKKSEIFVLSRIWDIFSNKYNYTMFYQYLILDRTYLIDSVISINGILIAIEVNEEGHKYIDRDEKIKRNEALRVYCESIFELDVSRDPNKISSDVIDIFIQKIHNKIIKIEFIYASNIRVEQLLDSTLTIETIYYQMINEAILSTQMFPISMENLMKFLGLKDRKSVFKVIDKYYVESKNLKYPEYVFGLDYVSITQGEIMSYVFDYDLVTNDTRLLLYHFKEIVTKLLVNNNFIDPKFDSFGWLTWGGRPPQVSSGKSYKTRFVKFSKSGFLKYVMLSNSINARTCRNILLIAYEKFHMLVSLYRTNLVKNQRNHEKIEKVVVNFRKNLKNKEQNLFDFILNERDNKFDVCFESLKNAENKIKILENENNKLKSMVLLLKKT